MKAVHGVRTGGGLLLFVLLLAGLSSMLLTADLDGLRQRAQLAAMERGYSLLLRGAEQALGEAERELSGLAPASLPCRGRTCFAAHCPRGYCFHGEYSATAGIPCRLHPQSLPPYMQPESWAEAVLPQRDRSGERRFSRISEFRCFLPDTEVPGGIPLFRISVRAADGRRQLVLQSLYSARGRHGWRRLE